MFVETVMAIVMTMASMVADVETPAIVEETRVETAVVETSIEYVWHGEKWDTYKGVNFDAPSGVETGYNLPMEGVVYLMRQLGYSEEEYPYWIREDGMKMFGDYVMVGAYLPIRPKGTILPTSRGMGIVVDTGYFAYGEYQLDLAYAW